jgi:chromosome partitioning protein
MLVQASSGPPQSAHVIVLGNEKGGTGKSTLAMHISVALLRAGQRLATIDLDSRQKSFTRYIENRRAWIERAGIELELPTHYQIARADGARLEDNEAAEFARFAEAVTAVEHSHDFVVIDTPAADSYLSRLAHAMADTLITPLNDSFVDFDVLGVRRSSDFCGYRRKPLCRNGAGGAAPAPAGRWWSDRLDCGSQPLALLASRNKRLVAEGLSELRLRLGFRVAEGFAERPVYREFFPRGLTALDNLDEMTLGERPSLLHVTARQEVRALIESMRLPIDERGRRRAAARAEWIATLDKPLDLHDIVAD